jgi:hypothetical protein
MTRWKRDLSRLPGVRHVGETRGNHVRLVLDNGAVVITALTPGSHRALYNVRKDIPHAMGIKRAAPTRAVKPKKRRHAVPAVPTASNSDRPPTPATQNWRAQLQTAKENFIKGEQPPW